MDNATLITVLTIAVPSVVILFGTLTPAILEGRAVLKALDCIARQPEAADDLRATLLVSMALLESTAIYVLLVCLVIIFANPVLDRFF